VAKPSKMAKKSSEEQQKLKINTETQNNIKAQINTPPEINSP
jgi:hypothetical protein